MSLSRYLSNLPEEDLKQIDLNKTTIPIRIVNILKRSGTTTIGDLLKLSYKRLLNRRGLKEKSIDEIIESMNLIGYEIDNRGNFKKVKKINETKQEILNNIDLLQQQIKLLQIQEKKLDMEIIEGINKIQLLVNGEKNNEKKK